VTNAYRCGHCTRRARVRQAVRCARHAQGRRRSIGASSATASGRVSRSGFTWRVPGSRSGCPVWA